MNEPEYPTAWQKKTIWGALTTLSVVGIGAIAVGLIWLFTNVIAFLQPILIPFAVAGVLAYLFEPIVERIMKWGTSRHRAVLAVFAIITLILTGILFWIIPAIWTQTGNLVQRIPAYRDRVLQKVEEFNSLAKEIETKYGLHLLQQIPQRIENPLATPETDESANSSTASAPGAANAAGPAAPSAKEPKPKDQPVGAATGFTAAKKLVAAKKDQPGTLLDLQTFLTGDWLRNALPVVLQKTWAFITNSVGGFLGAFGFVISMIIVPIYLYYFLIESRNIAESWGDYLPLRASAFKDEVVAAISEINGYLIAFFRGQLLVSLINGTITGIGLMIVGLDFGLLIGFMLCFLGIIPYLGISLCWIPAVIIASVQPGSWLVPSSLDWYWFPIIVSAIFFTVQQIDGLFITPKIVGESVGLHPMTVIASVFVWSLLLGGLLGAILAVPMTATLKVLLRRYVWDRRWRNEGGAPVTEETFSVQQAMESIKPMPHPAK